MKVFVKTEGQFYKPSELLNSRPKNYFESLVGDVSKMLQDGVAEQARDYISTKLKPLSERIDKEGGVVLVNITKSKPGVLDMTIETSRFSEGLASKIVALMEEE